MQANNPSPAGLRAEADRIESSECTGISAQWCPIHGTCACDTWPTGSGLNAPTCPLHSSRSSHAADELPS